MRYFISDFETGEIDSGIFLATINTTRSEVPLLIMMDFDSFPLVERDAPFTTPEKKINFHADVARFNASAAFQRIVGFIELLNESVGGKSALDEGIHTNSIIKAITEVLEVLNTYIDEIPPSTGPRRYGNIAFRKWTERMEEVTHSLHNFVD